MLRGRILPVFPSFLSLFFLKENGIVQLICLQKANGSWDLDEDLAKVLGVNLEDIKAAQPAKVRFKGK